MAIRQDFSRYHSVNHVIQGRIVPMNMEAILLVIVRPDIGVNMALIGRTQQETMLRAVQQTWMVHVHILMEKKQEKAVYAQSENIVQKEHFSQGIVHLELMVQWLSFLLVGLVCKGSIALVRILNTQVVRALLDTTVQMAPKRNSRIHVQ